MVPTDAQREERLQAPAVGRWLTCPECGGSISVTNDGDWNRCLCPHTHHVILPPRLKP